MKKIFICLSIIFSLFCFCGCKNEQTTLTNKDFILFSTQVYSQGQIVQNVAFGANLDRIKTLSISQNEQTLFLSNLIDMVNKRRDEFLFNFALVYLSSPNEDFKIGTGVILSNVAYFEESDSVGFSITFPSLESFSYYHNNSGDGVAKTKSNIFLSKSLTSSNFVFRAKTSEGELVGQKWKEEFLQASKGLSFEDNLRKQYSPTFLYSYASPFKSLRTNANIKAKTDGLYYHIWSVENEDLAEENNIEFWQYEINYKMWYLILFIFVLLFISICLFIPKLKRKKNF